MAGFRVPNANQGGGGPKDCVTVPRKLASNAFLSPDYDHAFFAIMSSSRFHGKTRFLIPGEVKKKEENYIRLCSNHINFTKEFQVSLVF